MRRLQRVVGILIALAGSTGADARDLNFVTIEVAPWASIDKKTGEQVGLFPAVVHELERRTQHHIAISLQPFARIDHELESGRQDCTIIVWTEERGRIVVKGELVSNHEIGVIPRKGVKLDRYEDLRGKTISVLRGLSLGSRFDADPAIKKDFDTDYLMAINKVFHNRVDAVAGASHTIQFLVKEKGLTDYFGPALKLGTIPLVLQCARKSPNLDLMPAFSKAIRDMWADGTISRLEKAY
jgi:polar amino acid transport system substrate-binding protein